MDRSRKAEEIRGAFRLVTQTDGPMHNAAAAADATDADTVAGTLTQR